MARKKQAIHHPDGLLFFCFRKTEFA